MHRKILATCAALVALGALAVVPAMSSAQGLTDTVNSVATKLAVGAKITAYNEVGTTPILEATGLEVKCPESLITGSVHANPDNVKDDIVTVTIEDAWFQGNEAGTKCAATGGPATVTIPGLTNGAGPTKTHWCIKTIETKDEFIVEPHDCTGSGGSFTFIIDGAIRCGFNRTANIKGTITTGHPGPVTLKMEDGQEFKREVVAGDSIFCPPSGVLKNFLFEGYTDKNGTSNAYRPAADVAAPVYITP